MHPNSWALIGGKSLPDREREGKVQNDLAFDEINVFKEYGYCKVI